MLRHAGECTKFKRNVKPYVYLQEEFENFGKASGSKINHDKTKILKLGNQRGNHRGLLPHLLRDNVNTLFFLG